MKYIKTFEGLNNKEPKIGDYVICTTEDQTAPGLKEFSEHTIGKCIKNEIFVVTIQYDYVPSEILYTNFDSTGKLPTRWMTKDDILYFSPNKEDLEIYIDSDKYNL